MLIKRVGGNKSHIFVKMHSATVEVNDFTKKLLLTKGVLIHLTYVTVSSGQMFVQAI